MSRIGGALGIGEAAAGGRQAAWHAINQNSPSPASGGGETGAPAWARAMRTEQSSRHRRQLAIHTLQQGDRGGASATPDIKERNDCAMFFKRSVQRYGRTTVPATPYQRAGQLWDARSGSARVQARNWRPMAFRCLMLKAGPPAGLGRQPLHKRVAAT